MEDKQKIFAARVLFAVGFSLSLCSAVVIAYLIVKLSANQSNIHNLVNGLGKDWVLGGLGALLVLGISLMALPLLSFLGIRKSGGFKKWLRC